MKFVMNLFV